MLTTTFPEGPKRVRALGVWSGVNAAGGALGVLAGGLLTQYADWRWLMLINLPIVAGAPALVHAGVPAEARPARCEGLDVLGAILATGGVGLLVTGVVRTDAQGWDSPATWTILVAAAMLLATFVVTESLASAPLLRLGTLRSRWVAGANVLVFFRRRHFSFLPSPLAQASRHTAADASCTRAGRRAAAERRVPSGARPCGHRGSAGLVVVVAIGN